MGDANGSGTARICYHCKQHVGPGEAHNCWTTTEAALTKDLPEDLREAWSRLRDSAAALGEQRIYASHNSIMFARRACYSFVRPKRSYLEVCIFLGRTVRDARVRRVTRASASKLAHLIQVRHRDEVEAPLTDWLAEAYALQDSAASTPARRQPAAQKKSAAGATASKPTTRTVGGSKTARKSTTAPKTASANAARVNASTRVRGKAAGRKSP